MLEQTTIQTHKIFCTITYAGKTLYPCIYFLDEVGGEHIDRQDGFFYVPSRKKFSFSAFKLHPKQYTARLLYEYFGYFPEDLYSLSLHSTTITNFS